MKNNIRKIISILMVLTLVTSYIVINIGQRNIHIIISIIFALLAVVHFMNNSEILQKMYTIKVKTKELKIKIVVDTTLVISWFFAIITGIMTINNPAMKTIHTIFVYFGIFVMIIHIIHHLKQVKAYFKKK